MAGTAERLLRYLSGDWSPRPRWRWTHGRWVCAHRYRFQQSGTITGETPLALDDGKITACGGAFRLSFRRGRREIVGHDPLMVLDGAKNLEGAAAASAAVVEEFGADRSVVLVVGMLKGKSPSEMLRALGASRARMLVA